MRDLCLKDAQTSLCFILSVPVTCRFLSAAHPILKEIQ